MTNPSRSILMIIYVTTMALMIMVLGVMIMMMMVMVMMLAIFFILLSNERGYAYLFNCFRE